MAPPDAVNRGSSIIALEFWSLTTRAVEIEEAVDGLASSGKSFFLFYSFFLIYLFRSMEWLQIARMEEVRCMSV